MPTDPTAEELGVCQSAFDIAAKRFNPHRMDRGIPHLHLAMEIDAAIRAAEQAARAEGRREVLIAWLSCLPEPAQAQLLRNIRALAEESSE